MRHQKEGTLLCLHGNMTPSTCRGSLLVSGWWEAPGGFHDILDLTKDWIMQTEQALHTSAVVGGKFVESKQKRQVRHHMDACSMHVYYACMFTEPGGTNQQATHILFWRNLSSGPLGWAVCESAKMRRGI